MRRVAMTNQCRLSDLLPVSVIAAVLALGVTDPAEARDSWQEKMLFNPSVSQLELEKRGRVMIYDDIKESQVARAMDLEFERIQSMMFVRTIATNSEGRVLRDEETGDVVVEDDGC
jgi:hypothetical protein